MSELKSSAKDQDIQNCLFKIEEKLGWGASSAWSSYDFEKLSNDILQVTGMKLSVNTLKRVWGRLNYNSTPSTTTLNILAQYLGFEDWRGFITKDENKKNPFNLNRIKKHYWMAVPILILLPMVYIFMNGIPIDQKLNPSEFSFSSKQTAEGIPNSVIFEYGTPASIDQTDKLEIQQSWDDSKRQGISNLDSIATSIYYSPGYFMAKLVVNDSIIKQHGLLITSNGWLGIVQDNGVPKYLNEKEIMSEHRIVISDSLLKKKVFKENPSQTLGRLFYIKDFRNLYLNDITIDMVVGRNRDDLQGCYTEALTVYCHGQVIIVPLASKGCVSEINLRVLDQLVSGKTNDLSNFGVDMNKDTNVRLTSSSGKLSIFINDRLAYSTELGSPELRSVSGIRYSFQGSGSINKILIKNKEKIFLNK
ncbi:hypothetical protein [Flavimarina sp. Hel_I_48]|uniref:hypothetical protein n=1 Tax=Flavimarina sp. Hel_I_48 TaxID=1392488 RepID=UPI0004DEFA60|nr:hypothetical protein [Flavimarina sp. Hel_I_48]